MSWSQADDMGFNQAMQGLLTKLMPGAAASGSRGPAKSAAAKKEKKPTAASKGASGAGAGQKRAAAHDDDSDDLSGIFSDDESLGASPVAKKPRAQKKAAELSRILLRFGQTKASTTTTSTRSRIQMKSSFTHLLKTGKIPLGSRMQRIPESKSGL
jgi:hypothetical protein